MSGIRLVEARDGEKTVYLMRPLRRAKMTMVKMPQRVKREPTAWVVGTAGSK